MPKPRLFLGCCSTTLSSGSLLSSVDFARNMLSLQARFQEPVLSAIRHATRNTHLTNHFGGPILLLAVVSVQNTWLRRPRAEMSPKVASSAFVMIRGDRVVWCAAEIDQAVSLLRIASDRDAKNHGSDTRARRLQPAEIFDCHPTQNVSVESLCAFGTRPRQTRTSRGEWRGGGSGEAGFSGSDLPSYNPARWLPYIQPFSTLTPGL